MKNLEKFGINCASAEAQFGTGRGIMPQRPFAFGRIFLVMFQIPYSCEYLLHCNTDEDAFMVA